MKKSESLELLKIGIVVTVVVSLACINSVDTVLDVYGKFAWYLNYDFGFVKRALPGQILQLFYPVTADTFEPSVFNAYIAQLHLLFAGIFVFAFLFLLVYFLRLFHRQRLVILAFFCFLLSSYFMKEILNLAGYSDIVVCSVVLLSYCFYFKDRLLLATGLLSVSCLVSEIAVLFWLPVVCSALLENNVDKKKMALLSVPPVVAVAIHFCSIPVENCRSLFLNSDINPGNVAFISHLFSEQVDIFSLIQRRLAVIKDNFLNCLLGFFYLSAVSLVFFANACSNLKKLYPSSKVKYRAGLLMFGCCSFATVFLLLVAVDFWRLVYLSVFSSFLTLLILLNRVRNEGVQAEGGRLIWLGALLSAFTILSPPVYMSESYMIIKNDDFDKVVSYDYRFKNYRLTLPYFAFVLSDFYNFRNGGFDRVGWNTDRYGGRICPSNGGVIDASLASPGVKRIMIEGAFSADDPDQVKNLELWGFTFKVHRDTQNLYTVNFPVEVASRMKMKLNCLPSSADWDIKQFVVIADKN